MKPRKPIRRTSTARAKQLRQYRLLRNEFLLDNSFCFQCAKWLPLDARDCHHWAGRNGRLLTWTPGFRCVCRGCHDWIKNNPARARLANLIAPIGIWNDFNRAVAHHESNL